MFLLACGWQDDRFFWANVGMWRNQHWASLAQKAGWRDNVTIGLGVWPIDSQGLRERFSGDRQEEKHCLYVGAMVANPEGVSDGDIAQCYLQSSTPQVTATTKRNIHPEFTKTQAPLEGEWAMVFCGNGDRAIKWILHDLSSWIETAFAMD